MRAAFAAVRSPGRLERVAAGADVATVLVDAAHNPHGARALAAALTTEFRFTRLVGGGRGDARQGRARDPRRAGAGGRRGRGHGELLAARRWTRTSWARSPSSVFGSERVSVEPVLEQAIEQARELAEEEGASGAGVIVTGSVVTAGEARTAVRAGAGMTAATGCPGPTVPDPTRGLRGVYAARARAGGDRRRARVARAAQVRGRCHAAGRRADRRAGGGDGRGVGAAAAAVGPAGSRWRCRSPRSRAGCWCPRWRVVGLIFAAVWAGILLMAPRRAAPVRARRAAGAAGGPRGGPAARRRRTAGAVAGAAGAVDTLRA